MPNAWGPESSCSQRLITVSLKVKFQLTSINIIPAFTPSFSSTKQRKFVRLVFTNSFYVLNLLSAIVLPVKYIVS